MGLYMVCPSSFGAELRRPREFRIPHAEHFETAVPRLLRPTPEVMGIRVARIPYPGRRVTRRAVITDPSPRRPRTAGYATQRLARCEAAGLRTGRLHFFLVRAWPTEQEAPGTQRS